MELIIKIEIEGVNRLQRNLPEFIPESAEFHWDNIEILPVKELKNGICEEVNEGEEDFWSVYLHQLNGGLECVADLRTKQEALQLAKLLENASNYRVYSKSL